MKNVTKIEINEQKNRWKNPTRTLLFAFVV